MPATRKTLTKNNVGFPSKSDVQSSLSKTFVKKSVSNKGIMLATFLKDARNNDDKQIPTPILNPVQPAQVPLPLEPTSLSTLYTLYSSITTDHGYGNKRDITNFFPYFVPYMVNYHQTGRTGVTPSLKITVDIGLHSYLIVRKASDITEHGIVKGFNLYLDECALPANVNVITGNTMNDALLEENTLNFKHYLLTGPSWTPDGITTYLNKLHPTIADELKRRIDASILRARASGKLVNQAFPAWASEYEGAIEEIDRLLRSHIMHISSIPNYKSVANRTLHNRFCIIGPDDWKFTVKHNEVLDKNPPLSCSKLAKDEAPKLAFTILVRVDLCHGGYNYVFSLRLDRGLLQAAFPTASYIFKYSEMIEAFQSFAFRDSCIQGLLKLVHDANASALSSQLRSLWSSATFDIIESGCASIAKCIETDGSVKTLRLKCYNALSKEDKLCSGGIYLLGLPCINPNFNSLFGFGNYISQISQMRFCLRFQNNHEQWAKTINTFDSERSDDIIRVRSGNICPSMSSSSRDTGTSQDTLTTFSETVKTDVSKPEVKQFLIPDVITKNVIEIKYGIEELRKEADSLNANSTTLYKDGPVVNPGIFSKISSGISVLAQALSSWLPGRGGASSRNLVTKTKRKPVRSRSQTRRVGGGGGKSLSRRGGAGGGSNTRRRSLRRSNKKLK